MEGKNVLYVHYKQEEQHKNLDLFLQTGWYMWKTYIAQENENAQT